MASTEGLQTGPTVTELDFSDPVLHLLLLPVPFAVIRLPASAELPRFLAKNIVSPSPEVPRPGFLSVTRTLDETSVVVSPFLSHDQLTASGFPTAIVEGPWRGIKVAGPMSLSSYVGTLWSLTGPLKACGISIFALSTHDTDFVLVPDEKAQEAVDALESAGWTFTSAS